MSVLVRSGQYGPKPPFVNKKIKITEEKGIMGKFGSTC